MPSGFAAGFDREGENPVKRKTDSDAAAIPQAQRERLAYLEMRARFTGELRRPDIEARFGVRPAAASRDISAYREMAPRNLEYDPADRCYRPTGRFRPLMDMPPERVLSWISMGFGDGVEPRPRKAVPCEGRGDLPPPDMDVLAAVTRAIYGGRALRISYLSVSSGPAERVVAPVALADTGLRWHVRAFDRRNARFSDFVMRRIRSAEAMSEPAKEGESLADDEQWARMVDMEIVPHPGARWPQGIEADFAMEGGVLRLRSRAALVGYALRRLAVDCSPGHALDPNEHLLWLRNQETLYGVESAVLAPGRGRPDEKQQGRNSHG
jgi:hypothetical protein